MIDNLVPMNFVPTIENLNFVNYIVKQARYIAADYNIAHVIVTVGDSAAATFLPMGNQI